MTVLLALLPDAGHDQLWLLLAAQRMGPHLNPYGPLVFESNPPLAIWLSAIVTGLARVLHLSLTITFKLSVILLAAAAALVCARLLRRLDPNISSVRLRFLGIVFLLVFGAVPARDFGQRDHVLTLLILPYLLAAALDRANRRLSIPARLLITLAAALGLALKPHQALIALAVEVTLLFRLKRRLRLLEPAVFLACAIAYLAAIQFLAPIYFTQIVPILRDTYWAFGSLPLPQLANEAPELTILGVLGVLLNAFLGRKLPENTLVQILGVAGIAGIFAYSLQGTGWYYQELPALSLLSFALVLQLLDLAAMSQISIPKWLPIPTAALTILALTLTTYFSDFRIVSSERFPANIQQSQPIPDPAFFRDLPPNSAVATLTTSVDDTVPPAFHYHLILAQRYPHLWMLPAILRNQSGPPPTHPIPAARLAELDRLQHAFMVEDLTLWHPSLILVARCQDPAVSCQVLEDRHDDLLAWFLRDPAFAAIFGHYRFLRGSGPYDAYTLAGP